MNVFDRLPPHIQRRITVCDVTGCWVVNGDPSSNGYQRVMAHELTYYLATGVRARKRQHDHTCENVACCNPDHIDLVTPSVNCKRRHRRRKKPIDTQTATVQTEQPATMKTGQNDDHHMA